MTGRQVRRYRGREVVLHTPEESIGGVLRAVRAGVAELTDAYMIRDRGQVPLDADAVVPVAPVLTVTLPSPRSRTPGPDGRGRVAS